LFLELPLWELPPVEALLGLLEMPAMKSISIQPLLLFEALPLAPFEDLSLFVPSQPPPSSSLSSSVHCGQSILDIALCNPLIALEESQKLLESSKKVVMSLCGIPHLPDTCERKEVLSVSPISVMVAMQGCAKFGSHLLFRY
jgi:hypothetical protein